LLAGRHICFLFCGRATSIFERLASLHCSHEIQHSSLFPLALSCGSLSYHIFHGSRRYATLDEGVLWTSRPNCAIDPRAFPIFLAFFQSKSTGFPPRSAQTSILSDITKFVTTFLLPLAFNGVTLVLCVTSPDAILFNSSIRRCLFPDLPFPPCGCYHQPGAGKTFPLWRFFDIG